MYFYLKPGVALSPFDSISFELPNKFFILQIPVVRGAMLPHKLTVRRADLAMP
ncbi:MAG: hypothetical protein IPP49_09465 [Saprospiraceae bacterium]|nr:hypothetical protein [Saprospiraceae bacterium]